MSDRSRKKRERKKKVWKWVEGGGRLGGERDGELGKGRITGAEPQSGAEAVLTICRMEDSDGEESWVEAVAVVG
jgi:hypothetical protein